jgi:hypothetical protein
MIFPDMCFHFAPSILPPNYGEKHESIGAMMGKLRVRQVEKISKPGMHNNCEGLYLRVNRGGSKSWVLRTRVEGRRHPIDISIGPIWRASLHEAREQARRLRAIARNGGDPRQNQIPKKLTFKDAARLKHAELLPAWRNPGHGKRWIASLEHYAFPHFGSRPVEMIGTGDVLTALISIWSTKHDTARRVKQRIATVFDWAKGHAHFQGENPVNGVDSALPGVRVRQPSIRSNSATLR